MKLHSIILCGKSYIPKIVQQIANSFPLTKLTWTRTCPQQICLEKLLETTDLNCFVSEFCTFCQSLVAQNLQESLTRLIERIPTDMKPETIQTILLALSCDINWKQMPKTHLSLLQLIWHEMHKKKFSFGNPTTS